MNEHEALAIYKSIWRNSPAFTGYGTPRVWDLPTLHASGFPQTAALIRSLLPLIADWTNR